VKIHALCIVKDEDDVVGEALTAAATWCDHIYVMDNGSTDRTWEVVQALAETVPQVVPWRVDDRPFTDGMRAEIFQHFRSQAAPGDWWCRQDADEFYVEDPKVFLRKVPEAYGVVWAASFSYYFTDQDAALYEREPQRYADDVPVERKLRHYLNHWSEPRLFRHTEDLVWDNGAGFPPYVHSAPVYPVRIWLKHFPYRSPQQLDKRIAARNQTLVNGEFSHEAIADWGQAVAAVRTSRELMAQTGAQFAARSWRDRIVPAEAMDYDHHDGRLAVNEDLMPPIPDRTSLSYRANARARTAARRLLKRG
jgi:glycosyltransferase involved in cell wall biosynthesis